MVDHVYYSFIKSSERLENLATLPQRYCHKKTAEQCLQHIFHGKKKTLDEKVEPSLSISKYESQRGKTSNNQ